MKKTVLMRLLRFLETNIFSFVWKKTKNVYLKARAKIPSLNMYLSSFLKQIRC